MEAAERCWQKMGIAEIVFSSIKRVLGRPSIEEIFCTKSRNRIESNVIQQIHQLVTQDQFRKLKPNCGVFYEGLSYKLSIMNSFT